MRYGGGGGGRGEACSEVEGRLHMYTVSMYMGYLMGG